MSFVFMMMKPMSVFLMVTLLSVIITPMRFCEGHRPSSDNMKSLFTSSQLHPRRRQLAVGDFDRINAIIQNITLQLEDQTITAGELELVVANLQCQNIRIGDVLLTYQDIGGTTLELAIAADPFNMTCSAEYSFSIGVINGRGSFVSVTETNAVNTNIQLIAPNGFQNETPSIANVSLCSSTINVVDTEFSGNVIAFVLNLLEDAVSGVISNQANAAVCRIMDELGETFFSDVLNATSATFDSWLQPIPAEYSDPLHAERNYVPPEGVTLLSLASSSSSTNVSFSTTGSIGEFLVGAISNADSLLNKVVDDPTSPTGTTLEINLFLRDNFLDDSGTYTLRFEDFEVDNSGDFNPVLYEGHDKLSKSSIRINAVHVTGLDTMKTFNPLLELGQYTFRNELSWESLSIKLDLTVDVESSQLADPIISSEEPIRSVENITISLDLLQIDVNASLFVAIDQNKFDSLPLGSLLKDPVVCFLSALDTMEVSGLEVSLGQFSEPIIAGFESPGVSRLVETVIEAGFVAYEPTLIRAVPYFFQVPVRNIIKNDILVQFLGDNNECLSDAQQIPETSIIDFRDLMLPTDDALALGGTGSAPYGSLMPVIFNFLKDEYFVADPTTGLAAINSKLITDFGLDQSGTPGRLFFPGNFLNQTRKVRTNRKESTLRLRLYDIYINNIDSVGVPLTFLEPLQNEPYLMYNDVSVGVDRPLRFGFRLFLGISNGDNDIANDVEVFIDFTSLQAMLTIFAKVSEKAFMLFPLHDIFKLQCWLATIPAPQLNEVGLRVDDDAVSLAIAEFIGSVSELAFNISCIKCTGARIPELSELVSGLKDSEDVTTFANGVFNYLTNLVNGDFIQIAADRAINDAKYQCPHSPMYDSNFVRKDYATALAASEDESTISFLLGLVIVLAFLLLCTITIVFCTKFVVRRRHAKWVATLPPAHIRTLNRQQALQKETNRSLDASTVSMFQSGSIPVWMRTAIPIVILGNIGLFLSGHLSLAANVSLSATLAGQSFQDEDLFEFSVANSTIELWRAGGRGIAMIIFLLSFAWPYTKQLIILGLWFVPPSIVSVSRRGSTLLWLDFLGKWSIVDIFILVMVLVGFRISIESPDLAFLPDDFYSIDLLVAPRWGLYSNMIAQILSQISSHWIIHYHRRIVFSAAPHLDPTRSADISEMKEEAQVQEPQSNAQAHTERLFEHAFTRPHRGESDKLISRSVVKPMLYFLAILSSAFVVVGCIVPTYSLNQLGIIGLLVEAGQSFNAAYKEFSVFTTLSAMIDQASVLGNISDYIGLSSLSALILLTVLVVPILQVVVLLVQWFAPLTKRRRFRLMVTLEALQAWQYMEVYLLAVLVASWQLGSISSKLINPYCGALEEFFAELSYYGILKVEDAQCYRSDIAVEPTFYILLVAGVVLATITSFVSKAVTQYFRDMDPTQKPFRQSDETIDMESASELFDERNLDDASTIQPTPILFTDRYRWFLRRATAMESNENGDIPQISSIKSQGTLLLQNTSSTVSVPNTQVDNEHQYIDTLVKRDDSDMCLEETSIPHVSPTVCGQQISQQPTVTGTPTGPIVGVGTAGTVMRRGYDVDEDEWILESVSNGHARTEATAFLIEGAGVVAETKAVGNDIDDLSINAEAGDRNHNGDENTNNADTADTLSANECSPMSVNSNEKSQISPNSQISMLETKDCNVPASPGSSHNECSPISVSCIENSPNSQTSMLETKESDVSPAIKSNSSDLSQNGILHSSADMKRSVSMNSDEKSYDDVQQIPSSKSDIIFDDVPSSPDSQPAAFMITAASSGSVESKAVEDVLRTERNSDSCTLSVDPDVDIAAIQIIPSSSKSEDQSVAYRVPTAFDADDDNDTGVPDCSQTDDNSVDSDHTPRMILQMN